MIGLYLHHHGSGHRVRGTLIARELVALGVPVTGLGSGSAPSDWPGGWVELVRDDGLLVAAPGVAAAADVTAGGVLHWAPVGDPSIAHRQRQVVEWLAASSPAAVLVDVSVEVALQVRLCGVPVVVTALPGHRGDRPHEMAYDLAQHLLAPWPRDTHDRDWPQGWRSKTWHVGPISRFADRGTGSVPTTPVTATTGARTVLCLWGAGGTEVDGQQIEATVRATPGWRWVHRGGLFPQSADLWTDLLTADVVVTHAGQNAVADAACAGRPGIVVAQPRPYGEQAATAAEVDRLGAARGVHGWPASGEWPVLLDQALARGGAGWALWRSPGAAARAAGLLSRLTGARGRPAA